MISRSSELAHTAAILASEVTGEATALLLRVVEAEISHEFCGRAYAWPYGRDACGALGNFRQFIFVAPAERLIDERRA